MIAGGGAGRIDEQRVVLAGRGIQQGPLGRHVVDKARLHGDVACLDLLEGGQEGVVLLAIGVGRRGRRGAGGRLIGRRWTGRIEQQVRIEQFGGPGQGHDAGHVLHAAIDRHQVCGIDDQDREQDRHDDQQRGQHGHGGTPRGTGG